MNSTALQKSKAAEFCVRKFTTHGRSKTPEYTAWVSMMDRCFNAKDKSYHNYGGRGISVEERWKNPINFMADMGDKPTAKHTLDRIDVNGNYCPENCRWATSADQNRNRRNNKLTMANAREIRMLRERGYTGKELAREFGVSDVLIYRIVNNQQWKEEE